MSGGLSIRVKILTWNMGDNRKKKEEWADEIKKSWSIITIKDYDVLGLCLQEDNRGQYGKMADAVAEYLQSEFVAVNHAVEGPPEISKLGFSVRAFLYLRRSMFTNYSVRRNDICLKRTVFCSKATAAVSVIAPLDGHVVQIILMSSHLPFDPKRDDLGYPERIKAVGQTFSEVYDNIVDESVSERVAFWAGDLNFRNDAPINAGGNPMKDQLDYTFSVRPPQFFRDFVEPEVEFPPTCKMVTCDRGTCPACRNRSNERYDHTCYAQEVDDGIKRTPSHCDRILYRADGVEGEIVEYKSWGRAQATQISDHNLVLATFVIQI